MNGIENFKFELDKVLGDQMNFIDLEVIGGDNQSEAISRAKTQGGYLFTFKIRETPQFNLDKKVSAFNQSEQYLRSLAQFKQSKYHKEFKESRMFSLEEFVKVID